MHTGMSFFLTCILVLSDCFLTDARACVSAILRCIVRALKDTNTYLFDHLLALKPVRFLEGELIHDVSEALFLCTIFCELKF